MARDNPCPAAVRRYAVARFGKRSPRETALIPTSALSGVFLWEIKRRVYAPILAPSKNYHSRQFDKSTVLSLAADCLAESPQSSPKPFFVFILNIFLFSLLRIVRSHSPVDKQKTPLRIFNHEPSVCSVLKTLISEPSGLLKIIIGE